MPNTNTNLDSIQEQRNQILQRMTDAITNNDQAGFSSAYQEMANSIEQNLMAQYQDLRNTVDRAVLTGRGTRTLTTEETTFYQNLIEAMRKDVPQQALSEVKTILPETVIDRIFEDLRAEHPLLGAINMQNTGPLIKMLVATQTGTATWGELGKEVSDELGGSFEEVNLTMAQLTAFIPVPRYLLDLGPTWIDRYVREILAESIAVGLETAIVAGDGDKKPIGMTMKLTGAIDSQHTEKTPVAITDLSPATYGTILDTLSTTEKKKRRPVNRVVLIVNPKDYFTKVFPASTVRSADGTYATNVFPFPTTVIQSTAVTEGKAVMGLPEKYFMGIGTQSGGAIEYSDHAQFLKRNRVYLTYFYGYGKPLDENAFVLLDISGLKPTNLKVEVVETP